MIPRIKSLNALDNYIIEVFFDDGKHVVYDVKPDIEQLDDFKQLLSLQGLWNQIQLDKSRTCVFWNDRIDLASDIIYEYGDST